jgi:anti-sigma-K factor RskA/cell division protein FtsB
MNHEDYKEMLELEALGALEEAESRALQAHLITCAECRAELAELRDAAAGLIHLTAPVTAPPELRARILEGLPVLNTQQPSNASLTVAKIDEGADGPSSATSNVMPFSRPTRRRWGVVFGTVAAAVVFAALIILLIMLWNSNRALRAELARLAERNNEMQTEIDRLSQRNDELQVELTRLSDHNNERQARVNRTQNRSNQSQQDETNQRETIVPPQTTETTPDGVRVVALAGTNKAPGAHASLLYDSRRSVITLSVYDLPPAPAGKAYQLWFLVNGKPIPGGIFITSPTGYAMMRGQIPADARNASAFAVTLESSMGASAPTGKKYLLSATS